MPKYSRTAKYEDLRAKMQNDAETDVTSRDLDTFEKRLNQINSRNFAAPQNAPAADADPVHARRRSHAAQPAETDSAQPKAEEEKSTPDFSAPYLHQNENYTSVFDNEYLNEYIKEVKQYNKDAGNAFSTNTDLNVLQSLRGDAPVQAPKKPYPDEAPVRKEAEKTRQIPEARPVVESKPAKQDTRDAPVSGRQITNINDFLDSLDDDPQDVTPDTRTMTRDDIAAEVQNLINEQAAPREEEKPQEQPKHSYDDRTAREQLLNETTQMRAQMDDYEDNLNEFNDKMQHTNKVLNVVLIVLIIALIVILLFVIYWVLHARGIIG